jgi:hypothetical protein
MGIQNMHYDAYGSGVFRKKCIIMHVEDAEKVKKGAQRRDAECAERRFESNEWPVDRRSVDGMTFVVI